MSNNQEGKHTPEPCPTCGTLCNIEWSGLELVENTGDETLATKNYVPDGGVEELLTSQSSELSKLREERDEKEVMIAAFDKITKMFEDTISKMNSDKAHMTDQIAEYEEAQRKDRESNRELFEVLWRIEHLSRYDKNHDNILYNVKDIYELVTDILTKEAKAKPTE